MGVHPERTAGAATLCLLALLACGGRSAMELADGLVSESKTNDLGLGGNRSSVTGSMLGKGGNLPGSTNREGASGGTTGGSSTAGLGGTSSHSTVDTFARGGTSATSARTDRATGPWIFFDSLRDSNRSIFAITADAMVFQRVMDAADVNRQPAVSPDGKRLAFSSDRDGDYQVYLMPLPAGDVVKVTSGSPGAGQPAWSPDGTKLAYRRGAGAYLLDLVSGIEQLLLVGPDDANGCSNPVFLPSGSSLFVDCYDQIAEIALSGQFRRWLLSAPTPTVQHASPSPFGLTVACSVMCDPQVYSLRLIPLAVATNPCTEGKQLGVGHFPSFDADGSIAFETGDRPPRIGVLHPDGTTKTLTDGAYDDRNPVWAPPSFRYSP